MDKMKKARMEMIKKLAKEKMSDMPRLAEGLKGKKFSKVEVMADSPEGLEKGLSKAKEILKAKLGEKYESEEDESEMACEKCNDEGCPVCEESEEEEDEESY